MTFFWCGKNFNRNERRYKGETRNEFSQSNELDRTFFSVRSNYPQRKHLILCRRALADGLQRGKQKKNHLIE